MSQITTAITRITIITPVHMPALKIPSIKSQLVKTVQKRAIMESGIYFFIENDLSLIF